MKSDRILKKTGIYFIGNLASKFLVTILIPIYAFAIQPDELGYFDYTQTIMNILVPIIFLSIWEAILKFLLIETEKNNKEKIISSSLIWTLGVIILYIVIEVLLNCLKIVDVKHNVLVIIMTVFYALAQIFQYYARALGDNTVYVKASILGTLVNFVLVVITVILFKLGINGLYYSYILGQMVICFIVCKDVKLLSYFKLSAFNKKVIVNMIKFSAPLVLNTISAWLISGFGKIIIENRLGEKANGIYSFASKFSMVITTLGSIIAMAIIEEAIISENDKNFGKDFEKLMNKVYKLFASIITIAIPVIFILFEFFKNTEYYQARNYIIPLMIYAFATTMSINIGSIFQAVNKTKYQFITTAIGGILTAIISIIAINYGGIESVVIAQTIGMTMTFIMRYLFTLKFTKIKFDIKMLITTAVLYIAISILSIICNLYLVLLVCVITLIIEWIYNRESIKDIFKIIKNRNKK